MNWKFINITVGAVGVAAIIGSVAYGLTHLDDASPATTTTDTVQAP